MERYRRELIDHLAGFVTENRMSLFLRVLEKRTRYLTVLLEDIYQPQNASAVLRTCDCNGIQDVHIVEERNPYRVNPDVALGADQWLTLHYYNPESFKNGMEAAKPVAKEADPIGEAVQELKRSGYRIVATSPHLDGPSPEDFDLHGGKAAFLFGTELNGLTERALELTEETIRIPMAGFTESYNISVSAAIILYTVRKRLDTSDLRWQLEEWERSDLLLQWLRTTVKMSGKIEEQFRQGYRDRKGR